MHWASSYQDASTEGWGQPSLNRGTTELCFTWSVRPLSMCSVLSWAPCFFFLRVKGSSWVTSWRPQPACASLSSFHFCLFVSSFPCLLCIFSPCLSHLHVPTFPQHLALLLGAYFCAWLPSFCCFLPTLSRYMVLTTSCTSGYATLLSTCLLCRNVAFLPALLCYWCWLLAPLLLLAGSLWVTGGSGP